MAGRQGLGAFLVSQVPPRGWLQLQACVRSLRIESDVLLTDRSSSRHGRPRCSYGAWDAASKYSTTWSPRRVPSQLSTSSQHAKHQLLSACHTSGDFGSHKAYHATWRRFWETRKQHGTKVRTTRFRGRAEYGCPTSSCSRKHDAASTTYERRDSQNNLRWWHYGRNRR